MMTPCSSSLSDDMITGNPTTPVAAFRHRFSLGSLRTYSIGEANLIHFSFRSNIPLSEKKIVFPPEFAPSQPSRHLRLSQQATVPKSRIGRERLLSPADKLMAHKWSRSRTSQSVDPWLCSTNPFSAPLYTRAERYRRLEPRPHGGRFARQSGLGGKLGGSVDVE